MITIEEYGTATNATKKEYLNRIVSITRGIKTIISNLKKLGIITADGYASVEELEAATEKLILEAEKLCDAAADKLREIKKGCI